ncbi:MAG: hypothetical protein K2Y56_05155 [Methylobacterium sp.]|uniref:DUF6894 family protein n=1 Tax=Methylobacterium sp. TaxID=409 RepID=UPI0025EE04A1|nr:hypothetical protein [Methylobacterium sp.]MBX9930912.1 hypothetical protein [Methylobacterium sp.]
MPRYFFDVHNSVSFPDSVGSEHEDLNSVRTEARRSLIEIAGGSLGDKDALQLRMDVRDAVGQRVLAAALLMVVEDAS